MDRVEHVPDGGVNAALAPEYPKPPYVARLDFEMWCWLHRDYSVVTGEVARFVLQDIQTGCWPETRRMGGFHRAAYGRGAVGRENIWLQHLATDHHAGLDSPILSLVRKAHAAYLSDMATYWWKAEHEVPGEAPDLADALGL